MTQQRASSSELQVQDSLQAGEARQDDGSICQDGTVFPGSPQAGFRPRPLTYVLSGFHVSLKRGSAGPRPRPPPCPPVLHPHAGRSAGRHEIEGPKRPPQGTSYKNGWAVVTNKRRPADEVYHVD
jgi:hypothetical protein